MNNVLFEIKQLEKCEHNRIKLQNQLDRFDNIRDDNQNIYIINIDEEYREEVRLLGLSNRADFKYDILVAYFTQLLNQEVNLYSELLCFLQEKVNV